MAGGIDWFRWHHGSVTDPKFQLVARKSKQALASVIAVWAFVLEQASASEDRGAFGAIDCEAIDCLLGLEDGATAAILAAMGERGLVDDGAVSAWEKRQPKRERTDNTSTERSRAHRDRQRQEQQDGEKQRHATPEIDDATPRNATQHQKKPRGEESRVDKRREEEKTETQAQAPLPDWLPMEAWGGYVEMRKRIRKQMTPRAQQLVLKSLADMQAKGLSVAQSLDNSTRNSWVDVYEPKEQPEQTGAKRGSDEYAALHKSAGWWREAGFPTIWDAMASKCWHDNAHQFRDGQRVVVAA